MKKIRKIIAICMIYIVLLSCAPSAFADRVRLYTDFSGNEFSSGGDILKGTTFKIEIYNENKIALSGKLFYAFYDDNGKLKGVELGEDVNVSAEEETKSVTYTVKSAYSAPCKLKIMLWENDKNIKPLSFNVYAEKPTGANAASTQYKVFGEVPQDKLTEQMPTPFDVNNYEPQLFAETDFEEGSLGGFEIGDTWGDIAIDATSGTDTSACIKAVHPEKSISQYRMVYRDFLGRQGDFYLLRCKMKGEGLTLNGSVRPLIQVYDKNGKWLTESSGGKINVTGVNDGEWVSRECLVMIPEISNDLEDEEYYDVKVGLYVSVEADECTAYLDDVKLYKVVFEPMDTVLMTPNYKGLIYGDDKKADISLRVHFNDYNGKYVKDDFTFVANIADAENNIYSSVTKKVLAETFDVSFSSSELETGNDYYIQALLKKDGEVFQKQEWTLRKRAENWRPDIYIDEYNRFVKDGKVMFPLIQCANGGIYEEYTDVLNNTSVDAFTVSGSYHASYRTPRMQRIREKMTERNLGGLLEMCGYVYSNLYTGIPKENVKKQSDIRSLLTVMCNNFKDDERIWGYRIFDEQNAVKYGEELRWQNDILASLDINHPTLGITDDVISLRPGIYSKTADIIGVDPYFCTGKDNQDLAKVGQMVRRIKELNPNKPVFATIQGFWFTARGDLRGPTEQEYRNMAWQVICEGITLLDSYAYTDMKAKPWQDKEPEEIWAEQMKVYSEAEELENVILSTSPAPWYEILADDTSHITSMAKRYGDKSYIFAVNTKNSEQNITVCADDILSANDYYNKTEKIVVSDNSFSYTLAPYGVAIFEIEQPEFKSSHAEMKLFSVSDSIINYDEEGIAEICVLNGKKALDYKVHASDFSKLYINGTEAQMSGSVNIDGLSALTVKIVSEDEKNYTQKTYTLSK